MRTLLIGLALGVAFGASTVLADPWTWDGNPWPFTSSRIITIEVLGEAPRGGLDMIEPQRAFRSTTTRELRHELITEYDSRRVYVVDDHNYDVVDVVCQPQHGLAYITPVARVVGGGQIVHQEGISVTGSSAICSALVQKVR